MALPWVRPWPHLLGVALLVLTGQQAAHAGKNDLQLLNLCPTQPVTLDGHPQEECSWVQRDGSGAITSPVVPDADGQARYRSLMSELGVAIAPPLMTPADTIGYSGFQVSGELAVTKINPERRIGSPGNDRPYWDGIAGVNPTNPNANRPGSYLTTIGGFVRKGLWLPLPAFEFGAGAVKIIDSRMYAIQGYAKLALQEGFHGWWLPSFAVRGSASQLLGTDQVDLTVFGVDVLASKAFSIGGTARIEPYLGWNMLFIDAKSGVIDATPGCDAYEVEKAVPGTPAPSIHCAAAQNGPQGNDLNANFTFPSQDVIMRQRWFAGFKLRMWVFFMVAQVAIIPGGHSRDESQPAGAADRSGTQQSYSLSLGLDF